MELREIELACWAEAAGHRVAGADQLHDRLRHEPHVGVDKEKVGVGFVIHHDRGKRIPRKSESGAFKSNQGRFNLIFSELAFQRAQRMQVFIGDIAVVRRRCDGDLHIGSNCP